MATTIENKIETGLSGKADGLDAVYFDACERVEGAASWVAEAIDFLEDVANVARLVDSGYEQHAGQIVDRLCEFRERIDTLELAFPSAANRAPWQQSLIAACEVGFVATAAAEMVADEWGWIECVCCGRRFNQYERELMCESC